MGETDTSVKAAKGKGSGGGKTTVDTPIPLTITPKKTDYTVVLDKTGATPAAQPILTFDIKGPPNWYFDVQLSRKDSNKLGEGPGLTGAWDSSKTREVRRDTKLFSSWSNGEKTLKLDGSGKASYSAPLEWWKDQARRPRKDFDSEDIFYRVVASADSSGASPAPRLAPTRGVPPGRG